MAGDFNTDFNGDFSRVAYVATLAAEISFDTEININLGVAATLAAELALVAAIDARHGVSLALAAEITLDADLRAAVPVSATLNSEVQIDAAIVARQQQRRRRPAGGGGGHIFTVPPPPVITPPYIAPRRLALAAEISLDARIAVAALAPAPVLVAPPLPLISGVLLAGLTLEMQAVANVPFVDGDDEELLFMLAAAA